MSTQTFTPEQQAFAEAVRDLAQRECGTREQRDALTENGTSAHSPELYRKVAELGWLGIAVPEQYGGSGGGAIDMCLFLEEIAYGMIPIAGFSISAISAGPYERFGSEELKREVLGGVAAGSVAAIAMSEPGSGSDVGSLTCRAERDNNGGLSSTARRRGYRRPTSRRRSSSSRVPTAAAQSMTACRCSRSPLIRPEWRSAAFPRWAANW